MPKTSTATPKQRSKRKPSNKAQTMTGSPKSSAVAKKVSIDTGPRRLKQPERVWYRPHTWKYQPVQPVYAPLPKARILFIAELKQLWVHKKIFGGIALLYGVLNIILVRGLSGSSNLITFKNNLDNVFKGLGGHVASSATSFVYLLGTSGSGDTATSGIYQGILLIVCSLAFIWALRQTLASNTVRVRDSFYKGMYPLVPFMLLLLIAGIQLLPLAIGGSLYATVVGDGIAVQTVEKIFWLALLVGLGLWSLRMITSTLFALYVVTLPDMTPLTALRSARQIVYGRRLLIWRKLLFLPLVLLVLAAIIEVPLILFATALATWVFFVFSTIALVVVHGYFYNLYREMI